VEAEMNRAFKSAVAALIFAIGFAGSVEAGPEVDGIMNSMSKSRDGATAVRLLLPLAEKGSAEAQFKLGSIYGTDFWGVYNNAAALFWYRKAADQGYTTAQYNLAMHYAEGWGIPKNYTAALYWYRKAADQGDASAQSALAFMYFKGEGVPKDYAAGLSFAQKSADQGGPFGSSFGLADYGAGLYDDGDYATALKLLRPLANNGNAQASKAQYYLGLMYANGQGVSQDDATAVIWYRKAAAKEYRDAENNLGFMYEAGRGVLQDFVTAVWWYRKAANHDDALAQGNLGLMYAAGKGVPLDYILAYTWLNLAAAKGNKNAEQNRNKIAAKMSPAQITEAQKWAAGGFKESTPVQVTQGRVPLKMDGGTFIVPVQINGTMTLNFVIDSGASDVSIPADVVSTLMRAGTITEPDFIGESTYVLADGSTTKSQTFKIRTLKVGNTVLKDVKGSVASAQGSLLLGQSFLSRFKSWSIDNTKLELLLEPR
jgi:clan AA aspartic protease (TIGR02281 family)